MHQRELLYKYANETRPQFNDKLFTRSEEDIIRSLERAILSCKREGVFTINPIRFETINKYSEVMEIMKMLADGGKKCNGMNRNKKDNPYDYIDIKDTDIVLLKITYFISIKDVSETMDVYVAVPKIVNKYYIRIAGNIYSAMFQIVDGSTYNNSTSSSAKKPSVTLKTLFQPIREYKNIYSLVDILTGEELKVASYALRVFTRTAPAMKYIFAKFGLYLGLKFLGLDYIYIARTPEELISDQYESYIFSKFDSVFIGVPKKIFDGDQMTQSAVYTIYYSIMKDVDFNEIFTNKYWKVALGGEFSSFIEDKANSVLASLENAYDIETRISLQLPEDQKEDVYQVLRWMNREFNYLKSKDNLDISTKKIRLADYISSLYTFKLASGIYRVSDIGNRANIASIRKVIDIDPMYLIKALTKCKLVNYKNMSNDMDALQALKFTYKGVSGIGSNGKGNSVPDIYRTTHVSHLGRIDMDSSSNSDPGLSGIICPMADLYDNMSFSEYEEPNFWEAQYEQLNEEFKNMIGMKEVVEFKKEIGVYDQLNDMLLSQCINIISDMANGVIQETKALDDALLSEALILEGDSDANNI